MDLFGRKKMYKKGMADAMQAYEAFGKKQEAALEKIREEIRSGNKTLETAISALGDDILAVYDYLNKQEKNALYKLATPMDIKDLEDAEQRLLLAILYQLADDEGSRYNENQRRYINSIRKYLGITNIQTMADYSVIENIDSLDVQKIFMRIALEFMYLQDADEMSDDQAEFFDNFSVNKRQARPIEFEVIRQFGLLGVEGMAEKYGEAEVVEESEAEDEILPVVEGKVDSPFLMPIEDVFSIAGRGPVVTGVVKRGTVRVGDAVEIVGINERKIKTKVKGIESFHKLIDIAHEGMGIGILIDVDKRVVERGMVICKPDSVEAFTKFECEVTLLKKEEGGRVTPMLDGYRAQFNFGVTDVTGVLSFCDGKEMCMPGENVKMVAELEKPVALIKRLRFDVREGGRKVGHGIVTDILKGKDNKKSCLTSTVGGCVIEKIAEKPNSNYISVIGNMNFERDNQSILIGNIEDGSIFPGDEIKIITSEDKVITNTVDNIIDVASYRVSYLTMDKRIKLVSDWCDYRHHCVCGNEGECVAIVLEDYVDENILKNAKYITFEE